MTRRGCKGFVDGIVIGAWMLAAGACGSAPAPVVAVSKASTDGDRAGTTRPLSPIEEARQRLVLAGNASSVEQRCRLLREARGLDPRSIEARLALVETACAPARELVADALSAIEIRPDAASAIALATVATRANDRAAALRATAILRGLDPEARALAAKTLALFGEGVAAAEIHDALADERAAKGASVEAIDARLDAIFARAPSQPAEAGKSLGAHLPAFASAAKGYGAAWIGGRVASAIAAIRAAGEVDAAAKLAKVAAPQFVEGRAVFAIERAIADARAGGAKATAFVDPLDPLSRALAAVTERVRGRCASARGHAVAYERLLAEGPRFDADVAWAAACGSEAPVPSVVPPKPSPEVADVAAFAPADPLRARAMIGTIVAARPNDPSARVLAAALSPEASRTATIDAAVAALPHEPSLRLLRVESTKTGADDLLDVVARSLEGGTRASTPILARALVALERDEERDRIALAIVSICVRPGVGACLPAGDPSLLAIATARVRRARPALLVARTWADEDLRDPRVRLDVLLATAKVRGAGAARPIGKPLVGVEGALARAVLSASCKEAKASLAEASSIEGAYAEVFAAERARCP